MRLICLIFFCTTRVLAQSSEESLTEILTVWKNNPEAAASRLENLHQTTSSSKVSLASARLLAQAPVAHLKTKPALYAEYYLKNSSCADSKECFSLYRTVGDAYFESLDFKKAILWFSKGSKEDLIEDRDREYLVYKTAWAHLNANEAKPAYDLLLNWIVRKPDGLLREPMLVDLGRVYGEMLFSSAKSSVLPPPSLPTVSEMKFFSEGVLKSFLRSKPSVSAKESLYRTLLSKDLADQGVAVLVSSSVLTQAAPCEVMNVKPFMATERETDVRWYPFLQNCAVALLKSPKAESPEHFKILARWYQKMSNDLMNRWTLAKLFIKGRETELGCELYATESDSVVKAMPEWSKSWAQDFIDSCGASASLKIAVQTRMREWDQQGLLTLALNSSGVPLTTKTEWMKNKPLPLSTETKTSVTSLIQSFTDVEFFENYRNLCPPNEDGCAALAFERLRTARKPLDRVLTSYIMEFWSDFRTYSNGSSEAQALLFEKTLELKPPTYPDDPLFTDVQKIESLLKSDTFEFESLKTVWALPVGEDLKLIQKIEVLPMSASMTDEELIATVTDFQKVAKTNGDYPWKTKWSRRLAQKKLALSVQAFDAAAKSRGKTADERREWKNVGRLLKRWVRL